MGFRVRIPGKEGLWVLAQVRYGVTFPHGLYEVLVAKAVSQR